MEYDEKKQLYIFKESTLLEIDGVDGFRSRIYNYTQSTLLETNGVMSIPIPMSHITRPGVKTGTFSLRRGLRLTLRSGVATM